MTNETIALLEIFQTNLGSSRAKCDATGKVLWDRIEAVKLAQIDACLYATELEVAIMEVLNGERKAAKLPVEPMVRLAHYAATGTTANATLRSTGEQHG
jgi:hypothetical protein